MNRDDWRSAFGPVPASFERRVADALDRIEEQNNMKRYGIKMIALVAAAVLLLSATALALTGKFGALDFLNRWRDTTLPQAAELVTDLSKSAGVSSSRVAYSAQDMLYDGSTLVVTFAAEPLDQEALLIGADELLSDRRIENGETITGAQHEGPYKTIEELGQGRPIIRVGLPHLTVAQGNAHINDEYEGDYYALDGKLYYYVRMGLESAEPLTLDCVFTDQLMSEDKEEQLERVSTRFDVTPQNAAFQQAKVEGPVDLEYITVNEAQLKLTPVAAYLTLEYTVHENLTDAQREAVDIVSFNLQSDAGDEDFTSGMQGCITPVDTQYQYGQAPDGHRFRVEVSCDALKEIPDQLYLRPYYKLTGEWGAAVALVKE